MNTTGGPPSPDANQPALRSPLTRSGLHVPDTSTTTGPAESAPGVSEPAEGIREAASG
jgi:hypothetical protein